MSWLSELPPKRRPILLVEDHLYHIEETLTLLEERSPELLPLLTVICLDRPGPDTDRSLRLWLDRFPSVRWAAPVPGIEDAELELLPQSIFQQQHELTKAVAQRLRPGGLLLQDVQLETLTFIPRDRWWQSIYIAASVRGMFSERPPCCRFLSNKRGYEATFGVDLMEAGFDPRDVIDKRSLDKLLIPTVRSLLDRRFPFKLDVRISRQPVNRQPVGRQPVGGRLFSSRVGLEEADRTEVDEHLDLVLWCIDGRPELGGRMIPPRAHKPRQVLKPESQEYATWRALVTDFFERGDGVPVLEVGREAAPELAGRAEITNCAARHIHLLRSRLKRSDAIQTIEHAYRLDRRLAVGRAFEIG